VKNLAILLFVLSPLNLFAANPNLRGKVIDSSGTPVTNATVFIYTGSPKTGTSSFCPSCYPDCRKKAGTDHQGEFEIEGLNPKLIFRLLVVASGKLPELVPGVDPMAGPKSITLKQVNPEILRSPTRMSGVVISGLGRAVPGAVLSVNGISHEGGRTQWGGTD
jgi:hypothetical protein